MATHPGEPWITADRPLRPRTHRWGMPAFLLAEAVFLLVSVAVLLLFVPPQAGADSGDTGTSVGAFTLAVVLSTAASATVGVLVSRAFRDRWGVPAFLLVQAVLVAASVIATRPVLVGDPVVGGGEPRLDIWVFVLATALPTAAAAAVALAVTRWRGNGPRADLGLVWSWRDVGLGLALGAGGLVLGLFAILVWVSVVGLGETSAVAEALGGQRASLPVALAVLLAVVVVAPFCEEVLYRGLLWGALEKLGAGRWLAFAITTVAFALLHFELLRAPLLLVVAVPIGLARLLTGRLAASIVAHQVNNLLPGIVLFLGLIGVLQP